MARACLEHEREGDLIEAGLNEAAVVSGGLWAIVQLAALAMPGLHAADGHRACGIE